MKAWVLHGVGDLRYEEVERPEPGAGEALLRVRAAGICGSDIPRVYETGAHRHPLIPGHEFAAEVVDVHGGDGVQAAGTVAAGTKVGVFPLIPCRKCDMCALGRYEMCRSYDYLGSRSDGAFAEYVRAPLWNLLPLPEGVTMAQAAMLEPMSVAVHALRRSGALDTGDARDGAGAGAGTGASSYAQDAATSGGGQIRRPADTLQGQAERGQARQQADAPQGQAGRGQALVIGLGTIGMLLTMFLLDAGYEDVIVVGNKELQRRLALQLGVRPERCLDAGSGAEEAAEVEAQVQALTVGHGADLVYECVGRPMTSTLAITLAAPLGRVVMVGNPHGDISYPRDTYWRILRHQLCVMGTWNSSYAGSGSGTDDWSYVLGRLEAGRIHPERLISHRLLLQKLTDGLELMHQKSEEYCKVMIEL